MSLGKFLYYEPTLTSASHTDQCFVQVCVQAKIQELIVAEAPVP